MARLTRVIKRELAEFTKRKAEAEEAEARAGTTMSAVADRERGQDKRQADLDEQFTTLTEWKAELTAHESALAERLAAVEAAEALVAEKLASAEACEEAVGRQRRAVIEEVRALLGPKPTDEWE